MTVALVPLRADADVERLATEVAEGFGGDTEAPRAIFSQTAAMLADKPRPDPWGCYIAYDGATPVGTCAFKAGPAADGSVEIAYMTFPDCERRGFATVMAGKLTQMALDAGAPIVIAHTLPEENPSNRALRRNGFDYAGEVIDPEDGLVWRWERRV